MKPVVTSIVLYKLHQGDVEQINRRRADFEAFNRVHRPADHEPGSFPGRSGHVGHFGNQVVEGDEYPAIVVRTFLGTTVNLQVLLDGNDHYWATSRSEGDDPGRWSWPPLSEGIELIAGAIGHTDPRVGDQVHYVSHGTPRQLDGSQAFRSLCRAAFVTEVDDMDPVPEHGVPYVGLMVANPTGQFFQRHVLHDSGSFPTLTHPDATETALGDPILCGGRIFRGGTWHWAGH